MNGDGKLDVAVTSFPGGTANVLLGNGDGTFKVEHAFTVGTQPFAVAVGDVNGDGRLDLVTANRGSNTVSVLLGNGDGTFKPATASPFSSGAAPVSVAVADLNGDGRLDVAVTNSTANTLSVFLGNGNGTFAVAPGSSPATGTYPRHVTVAFVNGDGIPDLITANTNSGNASVFLGNGNGTFRGALNYSVGVTPLDVVARDFNGDGRADLAVVTAGNVTIAGSSGVDVLLGNSLPGTAGAPTGTHPFEAVSAMSTGMARPISLPRTPETTRSAFC